ncbi:MAG: ATP-binding protein, partial [Mariprofundaceae bacterium]|nr:ATP-binding protein [Mariprofundaceae bacterium]
GIAHDFNNMLAGMSGNLYLVQRDMQDNPPALKRLKRIEKQGYLAADVIRQLLTFARSGVMEKKDFNLRPFFSEIVKFAHPAIPENIEFVSDTCKDKMMVNGDPGRIQQAILNLITNARHAVEQKYGQAGETGGRISLRVSVCGKRAACRGECKMRGQVDAVPVDCVRIEVEDNGVGMDEATRGKIFDPYYTTKEAGRGTGLGLPMVQGCVELHGGCIEVESLPGKGSVFRCWLPLLDDKLEHLGDDAQQGMEAVRGDGEWILVADDNSDAREALSEILQDAGFQVITACDGEEARQLFFAHQKQLHAAFLDIVMPRCSGTIVAQYINEQCPGMPIVLMSGYDLKDTLASKEFMPAGNVEMLGKPWNMAQVNDALSRIQGHHDRANGTP